MKDCFVGLALCALNTTRIRLGPGVLNPVTRHPAVLANAMSAIQEVSEGRALLGLGGGHTAVYSLGLRPAPIAQLGESIRLMRALLAGEEYSAMRLTVTQGPVPIYVAANQPRM